MGGASEGRVQSESTVEDGVTQTMPHCGVHRRPFLDNSDDTLHRSEVSCSPHKHLVASVLLEPDWFADTRGLTQSLQHG